jgi:hypothetical protein
MMIEKLLKLFIAEVDAHLLKPIVIEYFKYPNRGDLTKRPTLL